MRAILVSVLFGSVLPLGCAREPCGERERGPSARIDVALGTCNYAPIADVMVPPSRVAKHAVVMLDGSGSVDLNADPITYSWKMARQPDASSVAIEDPTAPVAAFTPSLSGPYLVELVVSDGELQSDKAEVRVTVVNTAPIADAGADFTIPVGMLATVDGRGSMDPDGDQFTYAWEIKRRPAGSNATLSGATTAQPNFDADVYGVFELSLIVDDGEHASAPDTVLVGSGIVGGPPVANAGPDFSSVTGITVAVDGGASVDPDGDPLTFTWSVLESPAPDDATFTPFGQTASFVGANAGRYVLQLVVDDGFYTSAPDALEINLGFGTGISGNECAVAGCAQGYGCISGICVGVGVQRFSLTWDVVSDFDIHILLPDGDELYFGNPSVAGGELDVDDCVGNGCLMPTGHVENIVFFQRPPSGRYQMWVENFNGGAAGSFTLEAAGLASRVATGMLPAVAGSPSRRFDVVVP